MKISQYIFLWKFSAIDYMKTLDQYGIDKKYYNIINLPLNKNKWIKILDKQRNDIYKNECAIFLKTNGKIINNM